MPDIPIKKLLGILDEQMTAQDALCMDHSHLKDLQLRQEKAIVVSRGVYQQPFRFESWSWRVISCMLGFPAWLLDTLLPIMLPDSPLRRCWSFWTLALVLYVAIDLPLQIAFTGWIKLPAVMALSMLITASFCLDVVVHFRTAYITDQGELVRVPHLIALHYLRGMFLLDLVSALPLDEMLHGTSFRTDAVWLGLLKLPRLFRLARHVNALTRTKYINLVGVARLLGMMLLIAHWSACLWRFLSLRVPGWPWIFSVLCGRCSDADEYVFAFYRCFLLMLGDRPETYNNVERAFAVVLLSMGACLYAVVVSSITMLVTNMWSMESRHKQRASMLQDALRYKGAPEGLRIRVDEYYNFMASFDHPGSDGVSLLCELPAALHAEVLSSVFEQMLVKVQLFAYCERPFLWRLSQRLRLSLYMPGDVIYDVGSVGHDMYIIWKGAVGLTSPDGCMAALLCDNDHFGELGLMNVSTPRPHRAVALRRCDVVILNLWDLQDAMRDFPDSAHLVKGRALVQLEDHETGPAVWAASLATGKTPRHELHPQAPTPSTQANADGMGKFGGNAEGVGRLASLTPLNLQLLQRANSSNHRSSSLSSSSSSSSPISAVKHRHKSSGDGGGSDDDGSGCAATGAAAADTVSSSRRSFRSASRRLRQSWSMDARSPHPSSDPDGSGGGGCGGIGCPLAEATERGGVTAAEAHESFSLTDVTALSQPGSPLRCPPTDQAMQAAPDTGEVRKGILRRFVRPQACVMDELQGGTAPPGQSGQPSPRPHHYHHQQQHHRHQEQQQQLLLLPGSLPDPDPDPDPGQILPESCVVRGQRRRREEPAGPSTGPQGSMRASCVTAPPPPPCEAPGGAQARFSNRVQDELGRDLEVRHEGDDVPIWDLTADGGSVGEPLRRIIKTTHDGDPVHGRTSYNGNGHDNNNNNGNGNGNGTSGGFLPGSVTSDDVSVCALRVAPGWSAHGLRSGGDVSARVVGSAGNGSSRTVRHGLDGSVKGSRVGPEGALHRIGCDGSIRGFKPHGDSSDLGFGAGDGDSSVAGFRSGGDGRFLDGYDFISLGVVNRSGFRAECADLSVDGIDRMRSRASSTTGMETMRDDVGREDRDLRPPNLLVLHGQPFLGLDPLGPVFDEVATRAAAAAAEQQLRRRMRGGDYHIATTAAATAAASGGKYLRQVPGNSYGSAAYGGHDTTRELVRPAGVWEVGRRVRRSSLHVISSGPGDTKHRLRLASDGGGPFQEANSSANFRAEEQPRIKQPNRDDDSRCAVLEKQLAEAQRQMEVLFANPLQVPAFEAALRREVDAVTARLNGQMMAQLHKLQAMLHTVSAHAEDLSSQVTSVDDRLQRLEDEQHVTGAAAMAVMAAGISNGGRSGGSRTDGTWDGRDGPDALSIPGGPLGLKGPQAPPPVLLPLSTLNANTSNRFSLDAGRLMLTRQLSMRHTRRLSALEYGTLPDSEPLVDGGAPSPVVAAVTGGAAGLDAQPLQAMTVEDAALLAATVQRAVGSTSRRRRSALELSLLSYSSLMTTPGHEALQLLQPAQLPAIRSSQGQRLGTELDIGTGDDGDGGGGDDGSGGVTGGTTAPKQAISLSLPVEPTADGPPPGLNWRAASLRRSGRRTSWAILASQSLGLEGNSELDPVATVNGASASGGSGGGGGSLRPNDGVAGSPEPPARPLLPVDTARQHQLVNNIQRQVSFLADGLCLNDKQSSSCGCYSDISNTGASNDGGGSRGGSCEISVVKEYVMQQPLQSSGRGPALRRSKSNVQDRPGSGGGGVGNTTATKRRLSFRRSLTSVLREGSQRAQQTPMGGPRMSTISELRALLGFH